MYLLDFRCELLNSNALPSKAEHRVPSSKGADTQFESTALQLRLHTHPGSSSGALLIAPPRKTATGSSIASKASKRKHIGQSPLPARPGGTRKKPAKVCKTTTLARAKAVARGRSLVPTPSHLLRLTSDALRNAPPRETRIVSSIAKQKASKTNAFPTLWPP